MAINKSNQYDKNMTNIIGFLFNICGYVMIMNDKEENGRQPVETQKGLHQRWGPAGRQRVTLVRAQGSSLVRRVERAYHHPADMHMQLDMLRLLPSSHTRDFVL